jgi:Type II secretory pathway, component PulD
MLVHMVCVLTAMGKNNPGDQLITKIFTIDNGSATQLANTLRPMISPNNTISVYTNSNALVVTDYASNMTRITKIINDLNVTKTTKIPAVTVKLKYAYASDVAQTLQSYLGNSTGGTTGGSSGASADNGPAVNITVDPNSNSLIISSNVAYKTRRHQKISSKPRFRYST